MGKILRWIDLKPRLLVGTETSSQVNFVPGIYTSPSHKDDGRQFIVVGHKAKEKIYEVRVPLHGRQAGRQVILVTDSLDVLRGLNSRGFPLHDLATFLFEKSEIDKGESIFEIMIKTSGAGNDPVEVEGSMLRAIPCLEYNTFELRLIK